MFAHGLAQDDDVCLVPSQPCLHALVHCDGECRIRARAKARVRARARARARARLWSIVTASAELGGLWLGLGNGGERVGSGPSA